MIEYFLLSQRTAFLYFVYNFRLALEMEEEDNTIATDISELRTPRVDAGTAATTDEEVTLDEETRALLAALELDDAQISELASARPSAPAVTSASAATPRSVRSHAKLVQMLLERKQLAHELQLARLDLSQRKLELERLEAHHSEQIDAQREQLRDAIFQRDAIRAQLEAEIAALREDARRRQVLLNPNASLYVFFALFVISIYPVSCNLQP